MIAQALNFIFPPETSTTRLTFGNAQEIMRNLFLRLKDELLWPRILVRYAPPPDEIQPSAPDRS